MFGCLISRKAVRLSMLPVCLSCLLVVVGCGEKKSPTPTQAQAESSGLLGRWKVVSATINGEEFSADDGSNIHVGGIYLFAEDVLTKYPNPEFVGTDFKGPKYKYTLFPSATPKHFVEKLIVDASKREWPETTVIYERDENTLKLCWSLLPDDEPTPEEFAAKEGSNRGLYILELQPGP